MRTRLTRFPEPANVPPAGDFDYDALGPDYSRHRRADPRIAAMVHAALGDARTVLNVGAGAGSYEPVDRHVLAVEPSASMRAQRPRHLAPAINAVAEALPFDDGSVDAAMATVTVHQWSDRRRGLAELRRVARGPVVVLAFVSDAPAGGFWLADYAPELIEAHGRRDPKTQEISAGLGGRVEVRTVPIPSDCTDGFADAFYSRPERFLDPAVRRCQSAWAFVPAAAEERFVRTLEMDLRSGEWDRRYGHWRRVPAFEGALRLFVAAAP